MSVCCDIPEMRGREASVGFMFEAYLLLDGAIFGLDGVGQSLDAFGVWGGIIGLEDDEIAEE